MRSLPYKEGEEDGALGSHEMEIVSLLLDSLQKTAGCPREYVWKGGMNGKPAGGKERNHQCTGKMRNYHK